MPNNSKCVSHEFPELFHYTTVDAFKKIYEEKKFWATHYKDLADGSELGRFKLKVIEFIQPIILGILEEKMRGNSQLSIHIGNQGGIEAVVAKEAAMFLHQSHELTFGERGLPETFICSFCAHDAKTQSYEIENGLLSQWRGYATGGGVAIVLDIFKVEQMMQDENERFAYSLSYLGDIKYDDDNTRIRKEFCDVFEHFPKMIQAFYSGTREDTREVEAILEKTFDHFIYGSTLVKHQGFLEEKEVRIVLSPWPSNPSSIFNNAEPPKNLKKIKYRQKGDSEVRYIELFEGMKLPIKRVIVGPSRFQNFNYQTICDLVKDDISIKVVKSETPYLG